MSKIVEIKVESQLKNPTLQRIKRDFVNKVTSKIVPVIADEIDDLLCAFEIALDEAGSGIKIKICKDGGSHDED
jgi:hypothetical protein